MTFRCTCTFPISGPNKIPRFKKWAAENASDILVSLPPQVPVESESLTVRVKSLADRVALLAKLQGVKL